MRVHIKPGQFLGYRTLHEGYAGSIRAETFFSAEYSMPLKQIRKGAWFFPFPFAEDLCFTLFSDGAVSRGRPISSYLWLGGRNYSSYGAELHLETQMLFEIPLDTGLRASVNSEKETIIGFFITTKSDVLASALDRINNRVIRAGPTLRQ